MPRNSRPFLETTEKETEERITTGIPGLDELIEGGFVKGSAILITGGTGTGKTTFCAQFILEGLKKGEPGVYITMEEDPKDIKKDLKKFGIDFTDYEKKGILKLIYLLPFEIADIPAKVEEAIKSINAKRIVIDPISLMAMYIEKPVAIRKKFFEMIHSFKKTGATTILTSEILDNEIGERGGSLSRDGVSEFVVDGVIVLNLFGLGGGISRSLLIRKMRRTEHSTDVIPMEITRKGIVVKRIG